MTFSYATATLNIISFRKLSSVQNVIKQFAERILRRYFSYLDPIDEVSDRPGLVLASLSVLETARKTVIVFLWGFLLTWHMYIADGKVLFRWCHNLY